MGKNLYVQPLQAEDLSVFHKQLLSERKRGNYFLMNLLKTKEDFYDWFRNIWKDGIEEDDISEWLIFWYNGKRLGSSHYSGHISGVETMIFIAPYWKNKGFGKIFLFLSEQFIRAKYPELDYSWAEIDYDNKPSIKIFEANGYEFSKGSFDYIKYYD